MPKKPSEPSVASRAIPSKDPPSGFEDSRGSSHSGGVRVSFQRIAGTAALIGLALATAPAVGQERATHDLVWEREPGAETCPDRATFTGSIRTRVGYDPFQQGSRRQLHVRLSREPAKWRAELRVLDDGSERGSQRLEAQGADCSALFAAVVAVASVTLDEATGAPAEQTAQGTPSESKPEPTPPEPPPPVPNTAPPVAPRERPEPPSRKQPPTLKRWAIGFELVQDLHLMEDKSDVCGSGESDALQCFEQSPGSPPYAGTPQPSTNNRITAGFLYGNPRLLGDVQYSLTPRLAAELRLGWAFDGGPKDREGRRFWPLHLETGVRFWLADQSARLRGYLGTSLGIAQFDASFPLSVSDCDAAGLSPDREQCLLRQRAGVPKSLDVYKRLGKGFVSGRVGLAWRFADDHAWSVGLGAAYAFPAAGIVFEPNIGYVALF
jgi:hypothetical protein